MKEIIDYSKKENWYQIPEITKDVDTFYIYATEYILKSFDEGAPDFADLDNEEMLVGAAGEYLLHAATYADSTNVFMPYYRQVGLRYVGDVFKRDGIIDAAITGMPYDDILAAIDYYFEHYNNGRPFIIAGHSQGSVIIKYLLEKYFTKHPDYLQRMVAAYAIGYSFTKDYFDANPHLKFATGETDTGVIIAWNTEGPKNIEVNATNAVVLPGAISINPLNWKLDDTYAPASMNLGSIILNETTGELEIVDLGADAQVCPSRGVVVTHAKGEAMPEEAAKINEAFFGPEGRHGDDYSFFYSNIKVNVAKRVAAYMANAKTSADLVVYGKIFTAENNQIVEAYAVKDGKYVYVGDKKGAEAWIEAGKTEVVDYTGKGLVMPSCGNGHAHYSIGVALPIVGTVAIGATPDKFLNELVPDAVKKAREAKATGIFGFGWSYFTFQDQIPTRQQLDAICSDIPMYFADDEGHKGVANTLMLVNAGIMKADGTVLKKDKDIRGGEIVMGADGTPTGFLKEQAGTYTRSFLDNDSLYPVDVAKIVIPKIQEHLLAEGYTMYVDGWGNYFFNDNFFKAAQQLDQAGELNFVIGLTYEVESWMNVEEALKKAADVQQYATTRVKTNWLKLFMDGTVEGGTGYVEPLYPDGHQGLANWTEEELTDITRKTNAKGISMHIHTMGNKAVNTVVSAYANGGKDELRNTLVHVRNVNAEDYQRMADHNMYAVSGMLWHHGPSWLADYIREHGMAPVGQETKSYPMKSYFDNGIHMTSHSDFPATSGSPDDPFGIMEIAVTGVMAGEKGTPWWPEELITREQAIEALTINIAKQMLIDKERGSISTGKYADFLLVDKDVLTCPVTEIHAAKPEATYFEGKKVFSM